MRNQCPPPPISGHVMFDNIMPHFGSVELAHTDRSNVSNRSFLMKNLCQWLAFTMSGPTKASLSAECEVNVALMRGVWGTYRELRERRLWKASGATSEIWLLLRSLKGEKISQLTQAHPLGQRFSTVATVRDLVGWGILGVELHTRLRSVAFGCQGASLNSPWMKKINSNLFQYCKDPTVETNFLLNTVKNMILCPVLSRKKIF